MITMRHSTPKLMSVVSDDYYANENRVNQMCQFQPMFGEFQLIGDSLLVRFTNQILYNNHRFPFGSRTINYCINGQRIEQLRQRIKLKAFPLHSKVMVLIGTNDVLSGGNIVTMTKHFNSLLTILKQSVDQILILTLPPIPKLSVTFYHWTLIRQYNAYLKSLDDGMSVVVADICPLFTKFTPALEYEISPVPDPATESGNHIKKRKSWPVHRRIKVLENRRSLSNDVKSDETDYRNSTDTNNSVYSDAISSDDRENIKKTVAVERTVKTGQKRSSPSVPNQGRFVVKTFESVFGKGFLNRKKAEDQSETSSEKKPRKSPMDLNENHCSTDHWLVESGEDSMSEHVYKSQEETEYDPMEFSCCNQGFGGKGEFSKFIESLNENEDTPKKISCHRRHKRDSTRNEESEYVESSSSSDLETPKRQTYPIIDLKFRYFFEKSKIYTDENFNSDSYALVNSSLESRNYWKRICESRNFKNFDGLSERDKLLLSLSSQICHLKFYELFYSTRRGRIDMIHLNYKGLNKVKNFLISNNYVNV